jgi:hypothetical protein
MSPSIPYAREPILAGDGVECRGVGVVVPASTFELGSAGPASGEEPHPASSIAIATAVAIAGRYKRLRLILVMGRFSRSCTELISSLDSAIGRMVRGEA